MSIPIAWVVAVVSVTASSDPAKGIEWAEKYAEHLDPIRSYRETLLKHEKDSGGKIARRNTIPVRFVPLVKGEDRQK